MLSVLASILPEYCALIASGIKTVEVRKTRPKLETPFKVYVYCTLPKASGDAFLIGEPPRCANGKVICEFICRNISEYESEFYKGNDCYQDIREIFRDPDDPDNDSRDFCILTSNEDDYPDACELCDKACLSFEEIKAYIGEGFGKTFYGLHISDLIVYDKPKELGEFHQCHTCEYAGCCNNTCWRPLTRPPQSWFYVEK